MRFRDPKARPEVPFQHPYYALQSSTADVPAHLRKGEVSGGEGHSEPGGHEQHYGVRVTALRQEFGVPGERQSRVVDDPLVDRAGHQGIGLALEAEVAADLERAQDVPGVPLGELAGGDRSGGGDLYQIERGRSLLGGRRVGVERPQPKLETELVGAGQQQSAVGNRHKLRGMRPLGQHHAEIGADSRGLAGREDETRRARPSGHGLPSSSSRTST